MSISSDAARPNASKGRRKIRLVLGVAYLAFFYQQYRAKGFPFDRDRVMLWIIGGLVVSCVGRPWRRARQLLTDWLPFAALLWFYDWTRGAATTTGFAVHRQLPITIDKALFFGHLPTTVLQDHLGRGEHVAWWELGVSIVYASHFVFPLLSSGLIWARSRTLWREWLHRFMLITVGGLITYVLLPVAPPWMSAEQGLIPPLQRPVGRGWTLVKFETATSLLHKGWATGNRVAAVPSLHAAYSMLLVAFLWRRIGHPVLRWALLLYPLAMLFTLVYGAEHYVIDVLVGWLYVWLAFFFARRVEMWWRSRRAAREVIA